jgi:ammonium transporter, Amt family
MAGPRLHKFVVEDGKITSKDLQAHSPIISALGTFILLFGWLSFNASSTNSATKESLVISARAVANSVLCPATAGLMSVIIHQHQMGVHSLATLNNAIIGGAVAVTAGCAYYESWSSIVLGIITSFVNYYGPHLMISLQVDDPLDAFVCHGMNGFVGILGVGIFAYKDFVPEGHRYGVVYSGGSISLLGIQVVGSLFLIAFCAIVMWITLLLTRWYYKTILKDKDGLRIDKTAEILGMDIKYYDGYAYPDFNKSKVLQVPPLPSRPSLVSLPILAPPPSVQ